MMRGQSFNSDSSKIIQSSSPNEKKVIDTKHSLSKLIKYNYTRGTKHTKSNDAVGL